MRRIGFDLGSRNTAKCETGRLAQLQFDTHSPERARVNEMLSNFDGFAKAFHCRAGDRMIAQKACVIW